MAGYEMGSLCCLREAVTCWASNDLSTDDQVGLLNTGDVFIPIVVLPRQGLVQVISRFGVGWVNLGTRAGELK
jgi:hypothetical protein